MGDYCSSVAFENTCSIENSTEKKEISKEGKRYELVGFESLPDYLKDNEFILGYYRSEWPMKETILSIFSIHNETLNIWTHLIGFFIFLCLTVFTLMVIPRVNGSLFPSSKQVAETNKTEEGKTEHFARVISPVSHDMSHQTLQTHCSWPLIMEIPNSCLYIRSSHVNNLSNPRVQIMSTAINATYKLSRSQSPLLQQEPITRWPLFAFLTGAMLCLLISSLCHLVVCHSERTAYITLRLDYTGISTLIVTSFYPLVYYSFLCHPFYRHLYIGFITAFGVAVVIASLLPAFQTPCFRPVRAVLFSCMGVSGLVPVLHKLILFGDRPEAVMSTVYEALMGTFYGLGVVVYAARIPERWMPGRFDLVGHSHQLFHVLVIAGAYTHYLAGLEYLKWRDFEQCW